MTVELDGRSDIDLDSFHRVAWRGEALRLSPAALDRIDAARQGFEALLESAPTPFIYGVTTGYGQKATTLLDRAGRERQARAKPLNCGVGFGEAFPERVVRGFVLARLASMIEGHAAVTRRFVEAVAARLDGRPLPRVPSRGHGGSGEVTLLGAIFAPLLDGIELQSKEGNAVTNGSPCAAALAADAALAARRRLDLAVRVLALSIEAIKAPLEHYDPCLAALWGDPHQSAALHALAPLLEGGAAERRGYQAPVSYRIVPRVLGQAFWAAEEAARVAGQSLTAVTDNPIYLPPDAAHPQGRCLSNGSFQNPMATRALDGLAVTWADLALLCERHTARLLDGAISGLPDRLEDPQGRVDLSYAAMVQGGLVEQARRAAQPSLLPGGEGGGRGQTDVASPVVFAWHAERDAGRALDGALAVLAAVALRALQVTGRGPPGALAPLAEEVEAEGPSGPGPALPGPGFERLAGCFTARVFDAAGDLPPG